MSDDERDREFSQDLGATAPPPMPPPGYPDLPPPQDPRESPHDAENRAAHRAPEPTQRPEASGWARMGEELRASGLIPERKVLSNTGWRKFLHKASFGLITPGESPDERLVRELNTTVAGPLRGTYSVVVLGGKGGAGKTTIAIGVGSIFALLRNDKVVAIDGNPDVGANLGERIDPTAASSYREVLADERLGRYADMRSHVGQSPGTGLDVLAADCRVSDRDPLTADRYFQAHERLQRFYSILVTDSGSDVEHPVMAGILGTANAIILVASATPDGALAAGKVMDYLAESGYRQLLSGSVVVLNDVTGRADEKLLDTLVERFSRFVGPNRVFMLPYDPHIAADGVVEIDQLRPTTRRRFLEISAAVASEFGATADTPRPDRRASAEDGPRE